LLRRFSTTRPEVSSFRRNSLWACTWCEWAWRFHVSSMQLTKLKRRPGLDGISSHLVLSRRSLRFSHLVVMGAASCCLLRVRVWLCVSWIAAAWGRAVSRWLGCVFGSSTVKDPAMKVLLVGSHVPCAGICGFGREPIDEFCILHAPSCSLFRAYCMWMIPTHSRVRIAHVPSMACLCMQLHVLLAACM